MTRRYGLPLALAFVGLALLGTGAFLILGTSQGSDNEPELVVDQADLLSDSAESRIADYHRLLRANHDIDYRVLTVAEVDDISGHAAEAFRERDVGTESNAGHGLLLLIDPASDKLRIEVSRSLEPTYVDAFVAYIEQRQMTEFFAHDRVADGILATTEMIVTRAQRAEQNRGLQSVIAEAGSAGGGAQASARLNDAGERSASASNQQIQAKGNGPLAVMAAYRRAAKQRNDNPDLAIYSRQTREFMEGRPMTAAQSDNTVKMFEQCCGETVKERGDRAVVRYPIAQRRCPPHFMVREKGKWRLDLATMSKAIRMNTENEWRMANRNHPYMFAFTDWQLTGAGIPAGKASGDTGSATSRGRSLVVVRKIEADGTYRAKTYGMKIEGSKRQAVRGNERFVAFSGGAAKRGDNAPWQQHYLQFVCIDTQACWDHDAELVFNTNGERIAIQPGRYNKEAFDKGGASGHMTRLAYRLLPGQLTTLAEASSVRAQLGNDDFELSDRHIATLAELHEKTVQ